MTTEVEEQKTSIEGQDSAINMDRILNGDEAYTKEVNERLAGGEGASSEEPKVEVPKTEPKEEAKTEGDEAAKVAAVSAPDPDEVVETIVYRGQEIPVKRKDAKALMQKGRHLEVRLEEVAPLLALQREMPDIVDLVRTPEGRRKVVERIRQKEADQAASEKGEVEGVEGYQSEDVKAVAKISRSEVNAALKELGIEPQARANPKLVEAEAKEIAGKTRIVLDSLKMLDPNFEENMVLLKATVAEAERTLTPEQFQIFYRNVNDPRVIDPATGRPAFVNFYGDVNKERARRLEASKPAIPDVTGSRKVHTASGRVAPGSASQPLAPAPKTDLTSLPQADFNRMFEDALNLG